MRNLPEEDQHEKTFAVVTSAVALWVCITSAMEREPEGAPIAESLDMNQLLVIACIAGLTSVSQAQKLQALIIDS